MKKNTLLYLGFLLSSVVGHLEATTELTPLPALANSTKSANSHPFYPNVDDNPLFSSTMRDRIRRHLLPLEHPIKIALDTIFSQPNVIKDLDSFEAAGFVTVSYKTSSYVRVARHPALPGYLVKVYLDTQSHRRGSRSCWTAFTERCEGAENIRKLIARKKLQHFAVPDKWLYPVPEQNDPHEKSQTPTKRFILVVTDMELASSAENKAAWGQHVTHKQLKELYCILGHGYASTFLTGNIPYTKHHKFACVDTEFANRTNRYERVKKYIPYSMWDYWDGLVEKGQKHQKK
jgi:hypothetical protein